MTHRIRARRASPAVSSDIHQDADVLQPLLEDAAHVGGHASAVAFPSNEAEISGLLTNAHRVLAVGAQSSLTGGATPRGDLIVSTRKLAQFEPIDSSTVRAGAGVPLLDLQRRLAASGRWYPPVPTFEGAFVGGTIATNAAGAATFKYGSTRPWVLAATIVLADGSILDIERGMTVHKDGWFDIERADGSITRVDIPTYTMPDVAKHSGGYYARPAMDILDLFIGSEGTLGVIARATLRVIARPPGWLALVPCHSDDQAIAITTALRTASQETWARASTSVPDGAKTVPSGTEVDVAGIEYADAQSLRLLDDNAWSRANVSYRSTPDALLFIHLERGLDAFSALVQQHGVRDDVAVVSRDDGRAIERLLDLREAVPVTVNSRVGAAKARDARIEKTAGDMIVPFEHLGASLQIYRDAFSQHGLDHAIWGHFSDGNLHPNVLPRSFEDVEKGRQAILEIGRRIAALGGSPLAEHGVGRSAVKQALLRQLYGDEGIEQMRAVKHALDPDWKLADGVMFPRLVSR